MSRGYGVHSLAIGPEPFLGAVKTPGSMAERPGRCPCFCPGDARLSWVPSLGAASRAGSSRLVHRCSCLGHSHGHCARASPHPCACHAPPTVPELRAGQQPWPCPAHCAVTRSSFQRCCEAAGREGPHVPEGTRLGSRWSAVWCVRGSSLPAPIRSLVCLLQVPCGERQL